MISKASNHKHTYDAQGNMTCCTLEEKIYTNANAAELIKPKHQHTEGDGHDHEHESSEGAAWKQYLPLSISLTMLLLGIIFDNYVKADFFKSYVRLVWYVIAYLPVGLPVIKEAVQAIRKGEFFTEFFLMSLATIGAFGIKEYPEGVAVMLFYAIGELFQTAAVNRAKRSIKALLDIRPDKATVLRNGTLTEVAPDTVKVDEIIQVKAGEKVALDGVMQSAGSSFNTAALTGESKPNTLKQGETVLAGMINLDKVVEIKVSKVFAESSLARILEMVQNATSRKAKTELFIRKFSKIYTPIVVLLALVLTFVPYFFVDQYVFSQWLYRALIFLVISCPCALVISIPLGYFGGIGAASRNGILFKGSNYLDLMTKINTIVMDKTGTLTKGVFKVQEVNAVSHSKDEFVAIVAAIESQSTHPIAKAIVEYANGKDKDVPVSNVEEISGHGLKGTYKGSEVLAGNTKLLKKFNVAYPAEVDAITDTIVVAAINNQYAGYITIADELKEDAKEAVSQMHQTISKIVMLSGDKQSVVDKIAKELNIVNAYGSLLPEQKVQKVEDLKKESHRVIAFVGDGINDAPVLALSDVGIAMGALGSDAAIETADVIIQTDQPSKIITAIKISKVTQRIVWQNIALAFGVKVIVLALGAGGLATMWEAVFADVGVALLAILNAIRIQKMKF
ncbi:MAG: heavy metal translocating P-type ATPase [Bacteroidia bacterium]|nr:heavy metal translocating P-type ATPase [Bacteroidia bacterium]